MNVKEIATQNPVSACMAEKNRTVPAQMAHPGAAIVIGNYIDEY